MAEKRFAKLSVMKTPSGDDLENPARIRNAMTIDVEDYFQVSAFAPHILREHWDSLPCRVERNVDVALALLDEGRAALVGTTDGQSPAQFQAMLREHPNIAVLEFIEAPGTRNDIANLALGRMIRAAGIATHVPENGSVRSGAVELFLAGAERTVDDGAEFAVQSWIDTYGREPDDFGANAPENRLYLDYYKEMGMPADRAAAFYAMTNSVPHQRALWLDADGMRGWIAPERISDTNEVKLARLDLAPALP